MNAAIPLVRFGSNGKRDVRRKIPLRKLRCANVIKINYAAHYDVHVLGKDTLIT